MRIEIGKANYLLYLLLPYRQRARFMAPGSDGILDRINATSNEASFSGDRADYDRIHLYEGEAQTEYPAAPLVADVWASSGYGRALEIGAGSGYFTERIAPHAASVVAVEPIVDLQQSIAARCKARGLGNVEILGASALELDQHVSEASIDSVFLLNTLHHFHRREGVFSLLGRLVRPGGRLFLVEPHHNVRRVSRLLRKYRRIYRPRKIWTDEQAWGTHHFLTVSELRWLCRLGGFGEVRISGHWLPGVRRALGDDVRRRCRLEQVIGRLPGLRHLGAELALEARRHV